MKMLLSFTSESVWPMFSSKSLMVSGVIFRSLIHFNFMFVYGVRKCSHFILFHVAVKFSQHHLMNKLSFSIVYFASFVIDELTRSVWVYFWARSSVLLTYKSLCARTILLADCSFVV